MVDELKIKLTADVQDFQKGMKDAQDSLEDTVDQGEEAESSFRRMAKTMGEISPTFKAASDKWKQSSDRFGASFGKGSKMAKAFKIAGAAAIVGVVAKVVSEIVKAVVEAAKAVWQFAQDTAKAYDPKGFAQSAGAVEKSVKKLKTAVGSFTAPIVNTLQRAFSKILDGITWVVEKVRAGVAYITGILKAVFEPVVNGIKEVVGGIQNGINSLGNFLGIGDVFKKTTKDAEKAADQMGEITDATSAGLASFDKLNTLNISGEGDAEEAEKISDAISEADKDGQKLIKSLGRWFDGLDMTGVSSKILGGLGNAFAWVSEKAGGIWTSLSSGLNGAKDTIVEKLGGAFTWVSEKAGGIWESLTSGLSAAGTWVGEKLSEVVSWFSGAFSGVWEAITDVFAGVGEFFTGVWEKIKEAFFGVVDWFGEKFSAAWEGIKAIWGFVVEFFSGIWDGIKEVFSHVIDWFKEKFSAAWEAIKTVWGFVTGFFSDIWTKIKEVFKSVADWFGRLFSKAWDAIKKAWDGAVRFFSGIWDGIKKVFATISAWFKEKFAKAWDAIKKAWDGAVRFFSGIWDGIKNAFTLVASTLGGFFSDAWENIKKAWDGVGEFFSGIISTIIGFFTGLPSKMLDIGKDIINGLIDGITDTVGGVKDAIQGGIDKAISGVKNFLGIHSPSTKMRDEIGIQMGAGITEGVLDTEDSLITESLQMVSRVSDKIRSTLDNALSELEAEYTAAASEIIAGSTTSAGSAGQPSTSSPSSGATETPSSMADNGPKIISSGSRGNTYDMGSYLWNPPDTWKEYQELLSQYYVPLLDDAWGLQQLANKLLAAGDTSGYAEMVRKKEELTGALKEAGSEWFRDPENMPSEITAGGRTYHASSDRSEYMERKKNRDLQQMGWFHQLASGGAIAPNNPLPYILGDNKKEYEVISPVSLMEETVMSAMHKMGVGGGGPMSSRPIEVSIEVDGRKLARALYDPMETERKRRGVRA